MPIYRERENEFMVTRSGSKVLIVPELFRRFDHAALAAHIRNQVPTLEHVVVIGSRGADSFVAQLLRDGESESHQPVGLEPNDVLKLMFTSSTTNCGGSVVNRSVS